MKIPPEPPKPPTIGDANEPLEVSPDDSDAHGDVNPPLYRHSFSFKIVIFKIMVCIIGFVLLLWLTITSNNTTNGWLVFGVTTVIVAIYCYYVALRWNGEEFIVNEEWYERPLSMPFPFPSKTPSIKRSKIAKSDLKQTSVDKILGTCRLYSNTDVDDDKEFHNVKWLTHPAELRRATGISAPKRNSFGFLFKRRK